MEKYKILKNLLITLCGIIETSDQEEHLSRWKPYDYVIEGQKIVARTIKDYINLIDSIEKEK